MYATPLPPPPQAVSPPAEPPASRHLRRPHGRRNLREPRWDLKSLSKSPPPPRSTAQGGLGRRCPAPGRHEPMTLLPCSKPSPARYPLPPELPLLRTALPASLTVGPFTPSMISSPADGTLSPRSLPDLFLPSHATRAALPPHYFAFEV
jgi:hypothetical protein